MTTQLYCKGKIMMERALEALRREEGMGTIEIAIIIIVLVGLALLFRKQIEASLQTLLGNFDKKIKTID